MYSTFGKNKPIASDLTFVLFVQQCVSTESEISTDFLFRESEARDGWTDGQVQHLLWPPR